MRKGKDKESKIDRSAKQVDPLVAEALNHFKSRQELSDRQFTALITDSSLTPSKVLTRIQQAGAQPRSLALFLSSKLGVPVWEHPSADPWPELEQDLPETKARELSSILITDPNTQQASVLTCLYANEDSEEVRQLKALGKTIYAADPDMVMTYLQRLYRSKDAAEIEELTEEFAIKDSQREAVQALTAGNDDSGIKMVALVNKIIRQAQRDRASDIHIEPLEKALRIRFRVDGVLLPGFDLPFSAHAQLSSRIKLMAGMNIVDRRSPQDGKFTIPLDDSEIDVRASVLPTVWGEKIVLRLLDRSKSTVGLSRLGFPPKLYETYSRLIRKPNGMLICAGPTGAGKTTTLYSTLLEVNEFGKNLTTIEDPVEYTFEGINQVQTNEPAGLTFASGLRSLLRQDPDIILVGEIRDAETARIAVQAALTGHLVLSSIHGTTSVAALHRLLDMGVEAFLVASSVVGIIGQRLVRKNCEKCLTTYTPEDLHLNIYRQITQNTEKLEFRKGMGCEFCGGTGFRGRMGVYELLEITPQIKKLIVGWATTEEIAKIAKAQGMRSMLDNALELVTQDLTTIDEVVRTVVM